MTLIQTKCPTCGKKTYVESEKKITSTKILKKYACGHFISEAFIAPPKEFDFSKSFSADECTYSDYEHASNYAPTYERDDMWEKAYAFQREGVKFIEASNYQALIADEMGLGKTIQALLALRYNENLFPVLIVCPASLSFNWAKEIRQWLLENVDMNKPENGKYLPYIHTGGAHALFPGFRIYIVSQDLIWKESVQESIKEIGFKCFIGDEIHKFKNTSAKRTKGLLDVLESIPHRIVLSGTPIMNRFTEYFTALHIVKPDHWPTREIMYRYADYDRESNRILGLNQYRAKDFFAKTEPYVIRRKKKDVLKDLPELVRNWRIVEVNDEKTLVAGYNKLVDELEEAMHTKKGDLKASNVEILALLQKLRHLTGLMKIKHAISFIEEFTESTSDDGITSLDRNFLKEMGIAEEAPKPKNDTQQKLTIGIHHRDVATWFTKFIKEMGYEPLEMNGTMSAMIKQEVEDKFRNAEHRYLIASILATAEGRNLQFCENFLIVEREWNPAIEEQFELRFNRPLKCSKCNVLFAKTGEGEYNCRICGHKHYQLKVTGTYLIAQGTIDEFFHDMVEMKRAIKGQVLDPSWSIENDPDMIIELARKCTQKRLRYTGR